MLSIEKVDELLKAAVADGGVVNKKASFAVQTYVQWLNEAEKLNCDPVKMASSQQLDELTDRINRIDQLRKLNGLGNFNNF